jgi:superfamily II DNA or RNA helicase
MKTDVTLRNYQEEAIQFLNTNEGKLVLAMCPSSGKTETIIYYLNQQYKFNPNIRVLILPHSTNVLLDNFYQRLESRNIDFTYSADINDDVNVHVVLPQNHNRIVGQYDLIIIDEAHENYLAKTIQGIIKKTQAGKEILLTGTPSKFIGNKDFKLHFVALSDLCELYTPKLRIDIIESDYDWNGNYNEQTKELKNSYKFSKESTEISLKKTFDFLLKRNHSDGVEKTLIVCRNIAQSNYVKEYLTTIGFSSDISNSDNDKDSENVSKFKNNLIDILIVVNRARLGYDDTDLINLIDISGTLNPNIIYQMFARLLRGTQDMKKYYIRLASKNDDVYNSEISTSVALMLTHSNYIQVFNGKNFNSQEIIVNKDFFIKSKKSLDKPNGKSKTLSKRKLFIDVQEDDTFDVINFFKKVIEQKEKNVGLYKFCKVSEFLSQLRFNNGKSRTKEECIEDALKYKSRIEWTKNSLTIYSYACKKEWFKECTAHFISLGGKSRTKEECIEDAKKYKSRIEWTKNSFTIYNYALKKEWFKECTAHFISLGGKSRTKEECIEDAKKYKTDTEWSKNSKTIYGYARTKEWFKECTPHFINLSGKSRTKEECIEDAKKYKTQKEWLKNSKTIYGYAYDKKWMDECTANMVKLTKKRTKEECIEDAKKYKTQKEWFKNSKTIFGFANGKEWFKECTAHMVKLRISKTKKECIEDAKKYNSKSEWGKNSETIYGYAKNKKWLQEIKSLIFNQ